MYWGGGIEEKGEGGGGRGGVVRGCGRECMWVNWGRSDL